MCPVSHAPWTMSPAASGSAQQDPIEEKHSFIIDSLLTIDSQRVLRGQCRSELRRPESRPGLGALVWTGSWYAKPPIPRSSTLALRKLRTSIASEINALNGAHAPIEGEFDRQSTTAP